MSWLPHGLIRFGDVELGTLNDEAAKPQFIEVFPAPVPFLLNDSNDCSGNSTSTICSASRFDFLLDPER